MKKFILLFTSATLLFAGCAKVENEEIEDVDFLELRACDQSCPGGILTCDNRFLMCERVFGRARKIAMNREEAIEVFKRYEEDKDKIVY